MQYFAYAVLFVFFMTGISGCAGQVQMIDPKVIYSTSACSSTDQAVSLHFFQKEAQWKRYFSTGMAAMTLPVESVPDISFNSNAVLVVDGGSHPNAGYSLRLIDVKIEEHILRVNIEFFRPEDNRMQAQVVTHPCIAIRVPAGGYDRVELYDMNQSRLAIVNVKNL